MDEEWLNLDLMELFARCKVVNKVAFLKSKYEHLISLVDDDLNVNYKIASSERAWGPYGGYALEEDWRTKNKKKCDALFRILLIIHYSG